MKMMIAACAMAFSTMALGAQMDRSAIDGAVVIRVDTRNNSVSVGTTAKKMQNKAQANDLAKGLSYNAVSQENLGELDREAGASSWYWYGYGYGYGSGGYYNNSMYWYGGYYNPCYTYNYGYYNYYYYNSYGWYGW